MDFSCCGAEADSHGLAVQQIIPVVQVVQLPRWWSQLQVDDVFLRHGVESHALLSLLPVECVPAYSGRETWHMCDVSHFCFFQLVALAA